MRADRLLSLLMLLQARGRMTAKALSEEVQVSERTIYRDMEALSMAGVPLYLTGCQFTQRAPTNEGIRFTSGVSPRCNKRLM